MLPFHMDLEETCSTHSRHPSGHRMLRRKTVLSQSLPSRASTHGRTRVVLGPARRKRLLIQGSLAGSCSQATMLFEAFSPGHLGPATSHFHFRPPAIATSTAQKLHSQLVRRSRQQWIVSACIWAQPCPDRALPSHLSRVQQQESDVSLLIEESHRSRDFLLGRQGQTSS